MSFCDVLEEQCLLDAINVTKVSKLRQTLRNTSDYMKLFSPGQFKIRLFCRMEDKTDRKNHNIYKWGHCDKTFTVADNLNKHVKVYHKHFNKDKTNVTQEKFWIKNQMQSGKTLYLSYLFPNLTVLCTKVVFHLHI